MSSRGAARNAAAAAAAAAAEDAAAAAEDRAAADAADEADARRLFLFGLACLPCLHVALLCRFRARLLDPALPAPLARYLAAAAAAATAVLAAAGAWAAAAQVARTRDVLPPSFFVYSPPAEWWTVRD